MSGARDGAALEETGRRLGDALRRALKGRLARRMDGVSTDGHAQSAPAWVSDEQGVSNMDGGEAGQTRSTNTLDLTGGSGLAALPMPGRLRPVRDQGELR